MKTQTMAGGTGVTTILIADDDPEWAELLGDFLRNSGFDVQTAHSARQGLDILDGHPSVRAVISDVRMPEIDGLDFYRVVKHRFPAMLVILATGFSINKFDVVPHGVTILRKPLDFDELIRLLPAPVGSAPAE